METNPHLLLCLERERKGREEHREGRWTFKACVDILELRIMFEHFVKQSSLQISMRRLSPLFLPHTCVLWPRPSRGRQNVHCTTHREKGKHSRAEMPNQTAGDIIVLFAFASAKLSLINMCHFFPPRACEWSRSFVILRFTHSLNPQKRHLWGLNHTPCKKKEDINKTWSNKTSIHLDVWTRGEKRL